jgi:L-amino acid N-acyltransferase YncA
MANASSLKGLMTFLRRDEWREAFAEIQRHVFVACHNAGVGTGEMTSKETRDLKAVYYGEVNRLTAEGWRLQAGRT